MKFDITAYCIHAHLEELYGELCANNRMDFGSCHSRNLIHIEIRRIAFLFDVDAEKMLAVTKAILRHERKTGKHVHSIPDRAYWTAIAYGERS